MFCFGSSPALFGQLLAAVAAYKPGNSLKLSQKTSKKDGMGNSVYCDGTYVLMSTEYRTQADGSPCIIIWF